MPVCAICGYSSRSLQPHLKYKHSLTVSEYKSLYNSSVYDYNPTDRLKAWAESCPEEAKRVRQENGKKNIQLAIQWQKDHPDQVHEIVSRNGKITGEKINNLKVWRERVGEEEVSRHCAEAGHLSSLSKGHDFMARKALENNRYCKYFYESKVFEISRYFASRWEVNFIRLCETSNFITSLVHEPFGIPYFVCGKTHKYYPDFLVNQSIVVEIKPFGRLSESVVLLKKSTAEEYCSINNFKYLIVTEHDLPSIRNGEITTSAQQELKELLKI